MANAEYINIPAYGAGSWKSPVATATDLPSNGNTIGDVRVVQDTGIIYEWNGSTWIETAGPGAAVSSLNGLTGGITISAGANILVSTLPGTITITSTAASGTVTSVGLTDSTGLFNVTGSPITGSGTLTLASLQTQSQKTFLAAPSTSSGTPTFRTILASDIPILNQNTSGTASNITATTNSTLLTLPLLALPYSQLSGPPPTWNQNTTGTASNITATSNSTLTTLPSLTIPYSQLSGAPPTWNQNTTGTAANITATSNSTLTSLPSLILPGTQVSGDISGKASNITATTNSTLTSLPSLMLPYSQLSGTIPTWNQDTTGTASNITATTNSTITTLTSLALPYSQLSGVVPTWNQDTTGQAANITATSNSTLTTLSALSLPATQVTGLPTWADQALDNLTSPTALNVDLLPGSAGTQNIGNSGNAFANGYFTSAVDINTGGMILQCQIIFHGLRDYSLSMNDPGSDFRITSVEGLLIQSTNSGITLDPGAGNNVMINEGNLDVNTGSIINLATPVNPTDAANKSYIDTITTLLNLSLPASQVTDITATALTGYVVGVNSPLLATDTILGAFEKVQGQINSLGSAEVTAVTATTPLFSSGGSTPNITIQQATASQNGYLSSADWNTFDAKQNALTFGNLTDGVSDGITITGGTGAVIGAGVNITQQVATSSQNGYLASADWMTFNAKQPAGAYITALTGDVVATGPGSVASTIQTNVVSNSKLAQMPANTIKGNNTGSTANATDLTGTQVTALLSNFTGDSGSGGTAGIVPAPAAGTKAAGDFLSANGSWAYVDQSKPIYQAFTQIGQTPFTAGVGAKFENVVVYTGIDGFKQYAAVVAGGSIATLIIYDVTNPTAPFVCSSVVLAGAYNVAVSQISGAIYAFVPSSGGSTLYIRNITNPYSIGATSSLLISGSPGSLYGCVYANGYVYIATQSKGLTVVDVGGGLAGGTITAPVQSYQEGGTTNKTAGIAIFGNYVYTTNYQTTFPATVRYLKTWQLTGAGTLAVPYLANTYTIPGGPTPTSTKPSGVSISQSGLTAFVTDGNQDIVDIIDITVPTSPNYLTYITPSYSLVTNTLEEVSNAVSVNGNYLYVPSGANATNGGCIDLFDITNLSAPFKVRSVYTGVPNAVFGCLALSGGYIFAADYQTNSTYNTLDVFTQASLSPTFGIPVTSGLQVQQLTANTALIANGSQQLASSTTTATELSYVHGVTSSIQTQINALVSGGGISRSVSSVSTTTSAGSTAKTDYVYLVSGTTTITLPTAASNSNLYTIKNVGSGTVTIATASSQTIDGSLTATIPVKGTSLDLISDGSNWNVV